MERWLEIMVTVFCSVLASSGLWAYILAKTEGRDVKTKMLMGLAHDRIMALGVQYIERGDWITQDEYENLRKYLYEPYTKLGGNGSATRLMVEVDKLKIRKSAPTREEEENE